MASLARPGATLTGLTFLLSDLAAKRLEMLRHRAKDRPRWNPLEPGSYRSRETQTAAPKLGVDIASLEVRRPGDFEAAFKTALRDRINALIVVSSRLMTRERQRSLEFATTRVARGVTCWGQPTKRLPGCFLGTGSPCTKTLTSLVMLRDGDLSDADRWQLFKLGAESDAPAARERREGIPNRLEPRESHDVAVAKG
jgi:hypothetical protein